MGALRTSDVAKSRAFSEGLGQHHGHGQESLPFEPRLGLGCAPGWEWVLDWIFIGVLESAFRSLGKLSRGTLILTSPSSPQ